MNVFSTRATDFYCRPKTFCAELLYKRNFLVDGQTRKCAFCNDVHVSSIAHWFKCWIMSSAGLICFTVEMRYLCFKQLGPASKKKLIKNYSSGLFLFCCECDHCFYYFVL